MAWSLTVAAVIERQGRFLFVEETDGARPERVFNQPAGHVDPGEDLLAAVIRETREETGLEFRPEAFVGIYLVRAANGRDYARVCFAGSVPEGIEPAPEDPVILACAWLTREEAALRPRSSAVLACLDDYLGGRRLPLACVQNFLDDRRPADSPWAPLAAGWEELFPLRQPRLDLALGLAGPGCRCLDAGCATGSLPRALAARGRLAHGLDLDPAFLAVARRRALQEGLAVTWHEANLLDLAASVGSARFQLITCLGQTLPHLLEDAQWLAFFTQARDVLEPGGRLVVQAVHDAALPDGHSRELPVVSWAGGTLERRRHMISATLAGFETVFRPAGGAPVTHQARHRRMAPAAAAELLVQAGLRPGPPLADEAGHPFQETSGGWLLVAQRP